MSAATPGGIQITFIYNYHELYHSYNMKNNIFIAFISNLCLILGGVEIDVAGPGRPSAWTAL